MSQIKQLQPKEGVTLPAVKDAPFLNGQLVLHKISAMIHDAGIDFDYTILGIATEIPEEVWQGIVSKVIINGDTYFGYIDGNRELHTFDTATESAMSLLEKNEVYSVNPLGEKPIRRTPFMGSGHYTDIHKEEINELQKELKQWQQAQANTGTWVILQHI